MICNGQNIGLSDTVLHFFKISFHFMCLTNARPALGTCTLDCCTFKQLCEKWVKAIGKWLWLPGTTTNQCKAVLLADEKWAVCGSRAMRLATSLLFLLSLLVSAWLCMTAWANLQFAEITSPRPPNKKKLLSRITNQKHRPAVHLWGRSSKK